MVNGCADEVIVVAQVSMVCCQMLAQNPRYTPERDVPTEKLDSGTKNQRC